MGALDKMLAQEEVGAQVVCPKGDAAAKEAAWNEWEETLEFFRVLFEEPENWSATFTASFRSMLEPRERVACPCREERRAGMDGDATKTAVGSVGWGRGQENTPCYLVAEAGPLLQ